MKFATIGVVLLAAGAAIAPADEPEPDAGQPDVSKPVAEEPEAAVEPTKPKELKAATFGGGCFWCVEAVFEQLKGVQSVVSGYAGGFVPNPSYKQVCTGMTGHAEVVQITYDPEVISYPELLEVFWRTHDPTTPNRQGPDVGPQYRSIILAHDPEQRELAEHYKMRLNSSAAFGAPVVTEVASLDVFYPAEAYHQDYYRKNSRQAYCQFNIRPKLQKVHKVFKDKVK